MEGRIKVQNMVVSCNLFTNNCSVKKVVNNLKDVQYDPNKFPGACIRLKEPKVSILIFDSGRIVISGLKNKKMIKKVIRILKNKLKSFGVTFSKSPVWKVQNIVVSGDVGFPLNLNKIIYGLNKAEYNPEQFPGLVYKPINSKLSFLLFNTGKIVCTGGNNIENINKGVKELIKNLKKIKQ